MESTSTLKFKLRFHSLPITAMFKLKQYEAIWYLLNIIEVKSFIYKGRDDSQAWRGNGNKTCQSRGSWSRRASGGIIAAHGRSGEPEEAKGCSWGMSGLIDFIKKVSRITFIVVLYNNS